MGEDDFVGPTYSNPVTPIMSDGLGEDGPEVQGYTLNEGWERHGVDAYNPGTNQLIPRFFSGREFRDIPYTSENNFEVRYVNSDPLGGPDTGETTQPPPPDPGRQNPSP